MGLFGFIRHVARSVRRAVRRVFHSAKRAVHSAARFVRHAVSRVVHRVRRAVDKARSLFHRVIHKGRSIIHAMHNKIRNTISRVKHFVNRIKDYAKRVGTYIFNGLRKITDTVAKNPWKVIPIIGVPVLVGTAMVAGTMINNQTDHDPTVTSHSGYGIPGIVSNFSSISQVFDPSNGGSQDLFEALLTSSIFLLPFAPAYYLWKKYPHLNGNLSDLLVSEKMEDQIEGMIGGIPDQDEEYEGVTRGSIYDPRLWDPIETREEWEREVETFNWYSNNINPIYKPWKSFAMGIVEFGNDMNSLGDELLKRDEIWWKAAGVLEKFGGGAVESIGGVIDFPNEIIDAGAYVIDKEILYAAGIVDDPLTFEEMGIAIGGSFISMGEHFWNEFHDDPINAFGEIGGLLLAWEFGKSLSSEVNTGIRVIRAYREGVLERPIKGTYLEEVWKYSREYDPIYPQSEYLRTVRFYEAEGAEIKLPSGQTAKNLAVLRKGVHYGEHTGWGWEHIWKEEMETGRFHNYYLKHYGEDLRGVELQERILRDIGDTLKNGKAIADPNREVIIYEYNGIRTYVSTKPGNTGSIQTARPNTGG